MVKKALFAMALCLGLTSIASADFDAGMNAYRAKDFDTAFKAFEAAAMQGNETAQFNLGVMYYRGQGVEKDLTRAFSWIELSTQHGDESYIEAQEVLILFLSPAQIQDGHRQAAQLAQQHDLYYRPVDSLLAVVEDDE